MFTFFGSICIILVGGTPLRAVNYIGFYTLSPLPSRPAIKLMLDIVKKDINLIAP